MSRRLNCSGSLAVRAIARFALPLYDETALEQLPDGCVIDGEIVITTPNGLDFDALQMRLHPAASRVAKLTRATPASFVAFDLLAAGGRNLMAEKKHGRRLSLQEVFAGLSLPLYVTPITLPRL